MTESGDKICFVVMGFGEKTDYRTSRTLNLQMTYDYIIKDAVEAAGYKCVRADEIQHSGTIDAPMYEMLFAADVVIADLSTSNVNAAYELGVRHALKPRTTIVIAEEKFDRAFDLSHIVIRSYRHEGNAIDYGEVVRFRKVLTEAIQEVVEAGRSDSPVYDFLKPLQPPARDLAVTAPETPVAATPADGEPAAQSLGDLIEQLQDAKRAKDFDEAKVVLKLMRKRAPHDPYVVQQLALATYKAKAKAEASEQIKSLHEAREIIEFLDPLNSNDAESLGIVGAIHKRLFEQEKNRADLDAAIFAYEKGYRLLGDHYNGINWAYLLNVRAALSGPEDAIADFVLARRTRADILTLCEDKLKTVNATPATSEARYWIMATMAEAAAGVGRDADSERYLRDAEATKPQEWMRESTRDQLASLRTYLADSPLKHIAR